MGNNISGVILAGGSSRRFHGITKTKIEINGKSIIARIFDTVRDLFNEIIIVTNSPDEFKEFNINSPSDISIIEKIIGT